MKSQNGKTLQLLIHNQFLFKTQKNNISTLKPIILSNQFSDSNKIITSQKLKTAVNGKCNDETFTIHFQPFIDGQLVSHKIIFQFFKIFIFVLDLHGGRHLVICHYMFIGFQLFLSFPLFFHLLCCLLLLNKFTLFLFAYLHQQQRIIELHQTSYVNCHYFNVGNYYLVKIILATFSCIIKHGQLEQL
eukprot:TRINITY_DN2178_c0_g1_i2.p1 TRINITY_DN2178_c0_g1~~TRINITY_DN2178_c0_g1_i2.p1  ORF type:complete len:188 (+),score=-28.33 TRINITY_DN2178_c0_g1_i2:203-766(+)